MTKDIEEESRRYARGRSRANTWLPCSSRKAFEFELQSAYVKGALECLEESTRNLVDLVAQVRKKRERTL